METTDQYFARCGKWRVGLDFSPGAGARTLAVFDRYVDEVFRHMGVDHKKLDDPAVLAAALTESGFDAKRLIEAS